MSDLIPAIFFISGLLAIIFLIYGFIKRRHFRKSVEYVESRRLLLNNNSIDEVLSQREKQIAAFSEKVATGQLYLSKLTTLLKEYKRKVKRINVGLSPPIFRFNDSETLKNNVNASREKQYECINAGKATQAYTNWEWLGSRADGQQMVEGYRLLLLKAFNSEFEVIRRQMRASTFGKATEKLIKLAEQLARLGETTGVHISSEYIKLKVEELQHWNAELSHHEELKQEQKKQRALLREQQKQAGTDIEDLHDEIAERDSELIKARKRAEQLVDGEHVKLEKQIEKIKAEKARLEEKFFRATSQAQITRAGYIYVISNQGSFGEGVVKIGMTRRLEPMDRVTELGDASVPFRVDVHALAFVEDAPKLERALHDKFHEQRVNTENVRKEFFRVDPEAVKAAMESFGIDTDWYMIAEAREYNESLLMRKAFQQAKTELEEVELPEAI